jgi:anaerobic selenocysteine-containing dehydrogenase
VELNPADAERLGIQPGAPVQLELQGTTYSLNARLEPKVPPGVALVPRSLGVPVSAPTRVEVYSAEAVMA